MTSVSRPRQTHETHTIFVVCSRVGNVGTRIALLRNTNCLSLCEERQNYNEEVRDMGLPNRDELEGKYEKAKGGIKKGVGDVLNDPELEREGEEDRTSGSVREGWGKLKRNVGETIEDIGESINR